MIGGFVRIAYPKNETSENEPKPETEITSESEKTHPEAKEQEQEIKRLSRELRRL